LQHLTVKVDTLNSTQHNQQHDSVHPVWTPQFTVNFTSGLSLIRHLVWIVHSL